MDRRIPAEQAWLIPHRISQVLGTFSMKDLARVSPQELQSLISNPPLHRLPAVMGDLFYKGVQRIAHHYSCDAARIWKDRPSSAEVVYRFLEFEGIGPKIATMAANILARKFKIPFSDYFSIDISVDVHVRRVFERLGLCPENASTEQIIYKARAIHPEFPGILDGSIWRIGKTWCAAGAPKCANCYMQDLCPTALHTQDA